MRAPHHLGLKGTNLGPSLCNQTMGSKSALMSLRTLPLKIYSSISQGRFFSQDGIVSRQLPRKSLLFRIPSSTRLCFIRLANLFVHCNSSFGGLVVSFYRPLPPPSPPPTIVLIEKMAKTNDPENLVERARQKESERNIFHIISPKVQIKIFSSPRLEILVGGKWTIFVSELHLLNRTQLLTTVQVPGNPDTGPHLQPIIEKLFGNIPPLANMPPKIAIPNLIITVSVLWKS